MWSFQVFNNDGHLDFLWSDMHCWLIKDCHSEVTNLFETLSYYWCSDFYIGLAV